MTIDHMGDLYYDRSLTWMTLVGRLAFPIFAWLVAYHAVEHSQSPRRYLGRLIALAMISQPAYQLAMGSLIGSRLNVLFTLAIGLGALFYAQTSVRAWGVAGILLLGVSYEVTCGKLMDFGLQGSSVLFCFGLSLRWPHYALSLTSLILVGTLNYQGRPLSVELMTILVTISSFGLINLSVLIPYRFSIIERMRWGFYAWYPAHLTLLWLTSPAGYDLFS